MCTRLVTRRPRRYRWLSLTAVKIVDWYSLNNECFPCASAVVAGSGGHGDDGVPRGDELIVVPK